MYQGYGSTSKKAERQRALAESLMPKNIGAPVYGIAGGAAQLAQALFAKKASKKADTYDCLLYTSPSPRDKRQSRMPSSA